MGAKFNDLVKHSYKNSAQSILNERVQNFHLKCYILLGYLNCSPASHFFRIFFFFHNVVTVAVLLQRCYRQMW